jgi:glycosyltransferase involved in cell wall biosynthesis
VKFLLVNYEFPPIGGGAATATQAIARNLSALGHGVTVLTSGLGKLPRHSIEDGVAVSRVSCVRKRADRASLFEMFTFVAGALLRAPLIFIRDRPDAVIVFFSVPSGPVGLMGKMLFGIPYAVSLRGGDVPGLVPELAFLHKILTPLRRLVLSSARAVVANSEGLRQLSETADSYPVSVIPNGVDFEFFRPAPAGSTSSLSDRRLRLLFVGRFQEQKNLEFLFRQLASLPVQAFKLDLVGDGPQKKHLENVAVQLGIAKSINWHGWVERGALPQIYQSADCLVNPSLYEGMPNVVLEAMACGLPVMASNVPGNDALVVHNETGLLFDLKEPDGLLWALKQMHDVDLRRKMGARGRARAVANFSWRATTDAYLALFR